MERYEPPFEITNRMLNRVSSVSEKLGRIETWRTLERQPRLRRNNRIQSVHSSLKIEANSLSLDSVRDVLNDREVIGPAREMEYDTPYTAAALMRLLGLKSRDALRNNYLNPAIEEGLIQMTVPDKPTSRNQRYIKI